MKVVLCVVQDSDQHYRYLKFRNRRAIQHYLAGIKHPETQRLIYCLRVTNSLRTLPACAQKAIHAPHLTSPHLTSASPTKTTTKTSPMQWHARGSTVDICSSHNTRPNLLQSVTDLEITTTLDMVRQREQGQATNCDNARFPTNAGACWQTDSTFSRLVARARVLCCGILSSLIAAAAWDSGLRFRYVSKA
ncbi:hypothetical protein M011DRAFT_129096 [Sporormia fimetaria CBS 119925]|uniref:Uncharacterized protein n=1 Tax=Sporormia fimetaria CBS 119925 TaxID=1340428 RepID=A0A6A6V6B8_9PLEO|nr:hypothetical protein M011DRAFT_129096 [Sporormia fimetaria CBS 119925]